MRNNRFALILAFAAVFSVAWLALSTAIRAQVPGPQAAPPAAEAPEEPPTEAEQLIDEAIKKIAAIESVSADLVQDVTMLGQSFQIQGRYLKAPASRIYLKLTVSGLPGSSGTMLQVCDGEVLWDYQQVLESQTYRKLSVKPILERLGSPEIDDALREQILTSLGFAGPETLLVGLRKTIKFDQKPEEAELDGKPVYILRGNWRSREGLVGPDQRPIPPTGMLPPYIPSLAILHIDRENGWPYKLDLQGRQVSTLVDTRQIGPDGKRIGKLSSIERQDPSEIHLVYSNVQIGASIRAEEFAFQAPANANVEDNTELVLKGLNQAIEFQAMQKRAEAAGQEGTTLDQSIDIPQTPPAIEIPE